MMSKSRHNMTSSVIFFAILVSVVGADDPLKMVLGRPVPVIPYFASLRQNGNHKCGGTLISTRHVLTAGHCFKHYIAGGSIDPLHIVLGSNDLNSGGSIYYISRIYYNHYDLNRIENDVALLLLTTNVKLSTTISPIPLSANMKILVYGSTVDIFGHGSINRNFNKFMPSSKLTSVKTLIVPHYGPCASYSAYKMICGQNIATSGPCLGDSGGPVVQNGTLVGIITAIYPDCGSEKPVIFTKIAYYVPWILNMINHSLQNYSTIQ